MRLGTWFAGIDLDSRILTATLGFSSDDGAPRVLGCKTVDVSPAGGEPSKYQLAVRNAVSQFGEWFHLESGGALTSLALAIPGRAIQDVPSSGECHFQGPEFIDAAVIAQARGLALRLPGQLGAVLKSVDCGYELDGRRYGSAPVGEYGTSFRLELASWVARSDFVSPVVDAIETTGFEVDLIAARAEAIAETALTPSERREGAIVVSIGDDESEIAVLTDSAVTDLFSVPLGRVPLVAELSRACGVSIDVIDRLDLELMLDRMPSDPMVHRVRTVMSGWGTALCSGIRRRLDDRNLTWQLQAGVVIANSVRSYPTLDDCAARLLGVPARFASSSQLPRGENGAKRGSFASLGLISMQWRERMAKAEPEIQRQYEPVATTVGSVHASERGGLGQALGRWLREFVPADNH